MTASVLTHHAPFHIGSVEVRPATKTVVRGGHETVVEPRVMQVLVALAGARGAVVSRDDLVERCWDGRIVGDDAINRIMSRLRRLASEVGQGSFVIETVTKVGYRLRLVDPLSPDPAASGQVEPATSRLDRRTVLAVGAAVVALGGVGVALRPGRPSRATRALMAQADLALRQSTREGQSQAIGIYRQIVTDEPRFADGWAMLGMTYAQTAHFRAPREASAMFARARAAGERARGLERDNPLAAVAITTARPWLRHWLSIETAVRAALATLPRHEQLLFLLSDGLDRVGRLDDSLVYSERLAEVAPITPGYAFGRIRTLWSAGRGDEADALVDEASRLYPTHFAIWFMRYYMALAGGHPEAAIALAADRTARPSNIPDAEIESVVRVARALATRDPAQRAAVLAEWIRRARIGAGHAENTVQFAALLGQPDLAMEVLLAYYESRPFAVPDLRFSEVQGTYTPLNDRLTAFLFTPPLAPLRRRPDFAHLTERIGLADYWRAAGRRPDATAFTA